MVLTGSRPRTVSTGTKTRHGSLASARREARRGPSVAPAALLCLLAFCAAPWGCGPDAKGPAAEASKDPEEPQPSRPAAEPRSSPPAVAPREPAESAEPELFEGAWFTIEAPPGFTARPSLASETAEGFDSVFFESSDGRATFYVMSPQWGRQPTDVELDPDTETLVSESLTERDEVNVRRLEIAARDGSYQRLVEIFFSPIETSQWAFGFRWDDPGANLEYLWRYEEFKQSIEQYAD